MSDRHIIDNYQDNTVARYLRSALATAHTFGFVSAYFTIYGYALLEERLHNLRSVRFLCGDPASIEDPDPVEQAPKPFTLTENGLEPGYTLHQRPLARRCAQWLSRDSVAVRSVRPSHFLHGKLYLLDGTTPAAVVGSSNFTQRGLGGHGPRNWEINLATTDADTLADLAAWFDTLWSDEQRTADVKQQVLDALDRLGRDYAPEAVYFKTLYELFRSDMEAQWADTATVASWQDSQIWNTLFAFQQDGAKSVIAKLRAHNGCILADSVGLGKTYTALAVIKYFELRNERVLVLCPRKLQGNWSLYQASHNYRDNPFPQDRFGYTLLAHTDLSRNSGLSGGIDLAQLHWGNYDLVVIDESHNFRNDGGQRYRRLLEEVIKRGASTKVLMLSATPVNTSLLDLRNQIYLMTAGREDAFRESLGVGHIRTIMATAQRQFNAWAQSHASPGQRNKAQLLAKLGADFLRLLDGVTISRSRRLIEEFYAAEMDRVGRFPERTKPDNHYPPTDLQGTLRYPELARRIGEFKLAVYQPSAYVIDPARLDHPTQTNFNQRDRERFLVGMMRTNFLKRLESSAHALTLTLERTIGKIEALLAKIARYERDSSAVADTLADVDVLPADDEEDEEFFVNRGRRPYRLRELDLRRWQADLRQDRDTLSAVWNQVRAVTPERDGKLRKIKQIIRHKVANPTLDRKGQPNRKLLVFTTFKDTAQYLYAHLKAWAADLGIHMAMVSGDTTHTTVGARDFNAILSNFAPVARQRGPHADNAAIDLLIATDCISEGQNLQDCDTVLNYDIHWNPVRLVQRCGRIDRIGSHSRAVRMINFWPTADMDAYLRLQHRVRARMVLADLAATGDDDPFTPLTEDNAQRELAFRDAQLLKLREEILDLDDLDDGPAMGDFTLDPFFAQLQRYLERNREALEAMPPGVYAVADDVQTEPGVILFLRQRNADAVHSRQAVASPVHPFYFVYIQDNGHIRYGCRNARQILGAFETAASGKTSPIAALCDQFDRETEQGRHMAHYDKLLHHSIADIQKTHNQTQITGLFGSGEFTLTGNAASPRDARDFELITWLIIKEPA